MKILKKNAKNFCDAIFFLFFWCFFTIYYYIISWDKYEFLVISPLTSGPNTNQKQFSRDRTKIVKHCFEKCNDIFREICMVSDLEN